MPKRRTKRITMSRQEHLLGLQTKWSQNQMDDILAGYEPLKTRRNYAKEAYLTRQLRAKGELIEYVFEANGYTFVKRSNKEVVYLLEVPEIYELSNEALNEPNKSIAYSQSTQQNDLAEFLNRDGIPNLAKAHYIKLAYKDDPRFIENTVFDKRVIRHQLITEVQNEITQIERKLKKQKTPELRDKLKELKKELNQNTKLYERLFNNKKALSNLSKKVLYDPNNRGKISELRKEKYLENVVKNLDNKQLKKALKKRGTANEKYFRNKQKRGNTSQEE